MKNADIDNSEASGREKRRWQSLSTLLGLPLEPGKFLDLALKISAQLAALHKQNIIHRSINPHTILVNSQTGAVAITGFSTASRIGEEYSLVENRQIEGTPEYISPEQTGRMNRAVDHRTDLYSLGVLFYEMLTGRLPFEAEDVLGWVYCHIACSPRQPAEVLPETSSILSAIIIKLLAKNAEERYQTASGLGADLKKCLTQWETRKEIEPFALGEEDIPDRLLIPQKLYGRERDIEMLMNAFNRVVERGTPELIMVAGYSGIGKTSLIREVNKPVVQERGFFISGKFDQFKRNIPYSTLAEAFRELVRQILTESEDGIAGWKQRIQEALGINAQLIVDVIPEVELIIGKQPRVPELPPTEAQNRFNMFFRRFVNVFTKKEHPLVIFLDDLQWVDSATLRLLEHIIAHPDTQYLILIGAYRDNEVSPSHPLMSALDDIRTRGASARTITLSPLSMDDLGHLMTDTFRSQKARVEPLTRLVYEKTGGNPFFVIQFLKILHDERLVEFDGTVRLWKWDIARIRDKGFTDNVVDLMVGKLKKLSARALQEMKLAACVGNKFDVDTVTVISSTSDAETRESLAEAVKEGLLLRLNGLYSFMHDRIQEAAYSLVPEKQRPGLHLRIGRLLVSQLPEKAIEERVFDVVNQLNPGAALITEQDERTRIAEMNLRAARKAKSSTAYRVAVDYLLAGTALLGSGSWERQYELTFALFLELADCEFLSGTFDEAEALFPVLLQHARTRIDKASVYHVKIDTHTTKGEDDNAIESALEALRMFGIDMSPHPAAAEVEDAYQEVWRSLGDRRIEALIDLPLMTDPEMQAAMEILVRLYAPAYHLDNNLFYLHICHAVSLSLRHGNSAASTHAYGWFGVILGSVFHRYDDGYRFAKLAFDLMERHRFLDYKAKAYFQMRIISYWTRSINRMLEYSRAAFEAAVETGDVPIACFSCNHTVMGMLIRGSPLSEVHREAERGLDFVDKAGYRDVYDMILGMERFVQAMQGRTRHLSTYDDDRFSEAGFESELEKDRMPTLLFYYYVVKLMARFLSGDYEAALAAGEKSKALLWSGLFSAQGQCFYLYYGLALTAVFHKLSPDKQKEALDILAAHREQLREPADTYPPTFQHAYDLLSAEISRITGRNEEAMRLYEEAIRSARENGFVQDEALAYELAAGFYRTRGFEKISDTYLREARACYFRWGADGKVKQLDEQYPWLREQEEIATSRIGTEIGRVDAITVVKASQAISGEILLSNLIDTLMRMVIENAGAQKGYLVLAHGQDAAVEAQASVEGDEIKVLQKPHYILSEVLPLSLINYVRRTRESVILNNASKPNMFSSDQYIIRNRPVSVFCLPILRQASLIGLLYLENNLVQGAFTRDRIAVLEVLVAQAATSLENARIYEALRKSEELSRTRLAELQTIYATAPVGLCFVDTNLRFVSMNEELAKINGRPVEEHLGRTLREVLPDIADFIEPYYRQVIDTGNPVVGLGVHGTTLARPGVERDWLANYYPVKDTAGRVFGVNVVIQEITDRKRMEQRRAIQYAVARVLSESATLSDAAPRLLQVICESIGWEMGELWNVDRRTNLLRYTDTWHAPALDLREFIASSREATFVRGSGLPGRVWESGQPAWEADVVKALHFVRAPLAAKAGLHGAFAFPILLGSEIFGVMAFFSLQMQRPDEDLLKLLSTIGSQIGQFMERKRTEEALRFSEARYRALHRDNPTMIFTLDTSGKVLSVNQFGARQLGYTIEELEGQPVLNVFHEDDRPAVSRQLRMCLENPNQVYRWQFRKIRKDGELLWVEELAQAVYDLNGVLNVLVVCQDITDRKRAEEALRKAHEELEQKVSERTRELSEANIKLKELDRLKSMFIASMSHELRTPLNSVIGFSSILLNEWVGPLNEEQKENLASILRSGKHLLSLINDVIDVTKIEAGMVEPHIEEFDIADVLSEAATTVTRELHDKGLALQVEALHQTARTDRRRLLQCILNLMSNAVKFTEKGSVRVGVRLSAECGMRNAECKEPPIKSFEGRLQHSALATEFIPTTSGNSALHGDFVEISVTDTGIGIREADLPGLFQPFVRLESPLKSKVAGTGLGLYLTKKLVTEVLRGKISCISRYGEGSTFTMRIPVRIEDEGRPSRRSGEE